MANGSLFRGEIMHDNAFKKPQTVQAFEKWEGPDGRIYYHFKGMGGNAKIKRPPALKARRPSPYFLT
ncbi:hypothetical protein [Paenibacillus alkalitolerans]|uniref:hypothetical protein n=1 Tax=Paenibacillus alkalitolerans TaxID=2799335 RepID=UPI0018F4BA9A|nr:hypothetical protein [Paenibacillus alkalitolerans]